MRVHLGRLRQRHEERGGKSLTVVGLAGRELKVGEAPEGAGLGGELRLLEERLL